MNTTPLSHRVSRRSFLRTTAFLTSGAALASHGFAAAITDKSGIAIIVAPDDAIASAMPSQWALGELKTALAAQGATVRVVAKVAEAQADEFCVVAGGLNSSLAQAMVLQQKVTAPTEAEALCIVQGQVEGRPALLAAGVDVRGLVYALTELADRVRCLATSRAALDFAEPIIERPASRTRSIIRGFSSEVEDKVWFYDQDFWRSYLTMLVSARVNRFNFSVGMGYNSADNVTDGYFCFPYPALVAVPGYDVQAKNLSNEERDRNYAMLKFIGAECARRGLNFQLGLWTLAYVWPNSPHATYTIAGLTDATHANYCRDALTLILREVPTITGVTFRVHNESGIPKGQESFWQTQFSALTQCGRRVELDMHAKNMAPETLAFALATGMPVVISPKFCGEHMGLPYHQSAIRERELGAADKLVDTGEGLQLGDRSFTRYGYADVLSENRTWDVVFRIWPGTQRFLLNGDPALFAGYGRTASFCGAAGMELCEPLHFKGRQGSGVAGNRCAYADASLVPHYDFEKYLYTYRLWGRLGYNPDAQPEVWQRALRQDFGAAAPAIENALGPVSRVLPLFTLAHAVSADCTSYWPEIYTNLAMADLTVKTSFVDTRKPALLGNISPFDPQLFQSPDECADALVDGAATGKYSPLEVAQWLEDIAATATANLATARTQLGAAATAPKFRRLEEDVLIQSSLASFFAGKLRSGVLWHVYVRTGNRAAADAAIARYTAARNVWAEMAGRAQKVYISNITYCSAKRLGGHWLDRLPAFDADLADLSQRIEQPLTPAAPVAAAAAERALKTATAKPARPSIAVQHVPIEKFHAGQPLTLTLNCATAPQRIVLHYRHVDQAERWQAVELTHNGNAYQGEIPAAYTSRRFALQYYFEVETAPAEATLYPLLAPDLANTPYFVARRVA